MRQAWTIVPAMMVATLCISSAAGQAVGVQVGAPEGSPEDGLAALVPMLPLLVLAALAVGGLLRLTSGRWVASFVASGVVAFFVWWTAAAYAVALAAALGTWLFAVIGSLLWHPLSDRRSD